MSGDPDVHVSCTGCLAIVLACVALWALLFGVTWNGKTHGISCSCARGVEVK